MVDNQISWDKIVKALVDHGANVNAHNMYGHCALLTATEYKQLNIARYLLEHGANIHVNYNNMTPLSLAFRVEEGTPYNMELIELLINHGANLKQKVPNFNPVERALDAVDIKLAKVLVTAGANLNSLNNSMFYACLHQKT